jgi:valyl-tRNA synthetase
VAERQATWWTLVDVLDTYLRLLHPFMPFVTEAIWERLPHVAGDPDLLIVADWPTAAADAGDAEVEARVATLLDLVRAVRNARSEARLEPGAWMPVDVYVPSDLTATFSALAPALSRLARAKPLTEQTDPQFIREIAESGLSVIVGEMEAVVRPAGKDGEQEARDRARLEREFAEARSMLASAEARLANEAFTSKAPPAVVEGARVRAAELRELVERLAARLG